jgi:superfamily II DNA or RNA helicase
MSITDPQKPPNWLAYEHQSIAHYAREHPNAQVWHWQNVPEMHLVKSGWSLADLRMARSLTGVVCEYGFDGLAYDPVTRAYTGIQCKYYENAWITHCAIATFVATIFDCIAPANALLDEDDGSPSSSHVNGVLYTPAATRVHPRVTHSFAESYARARIAHTQLDLTAVDDDRAPKTTIELRDYQLEAVERMLHALGGSAGIDIDLSESETWSDGGHRQLVACAGMPCGTGKTLVAAELIVRLDERVVVVVSPLIALCEQNVERMGAWFAGKRAVARVWSGATAERRRGAKRNGKGDVIECVVERAATALADAIERAYADGDDAEPLVIFVTFASAQDVLDALGDRPFALVVDEAHNAPGDAGVRALVEACTRAALFTATPTDELVIELNAEIAYRMTLAEAIERGLVCDYELVIPRAIDLAQGGWEVQLSAFGDDDDREMVARCAFLAARMLLDGARKCVVFCRTKDECRRFVRIFERVCVDHHAVRCCASVVVDETTRGERCAILARFAIAAGEEYGDDDSTHARRAPTLSIVAAVRVLDEGVDIPACDSVFFAHKPVASDSAMVRTVQRMCRANRVYAGKAPLMHAYLWASPDDVELAGALELLRAEDPRLSRKAVVRGGAYDAASSPAAADAVEADETALTSAFVERFKLTGVAFGDAAWQRFLAALTAYRASHGHCRVPQSHTTADGLKLGKAVQNMRSRELYASLDRRAHLDALGFVWDTLDEAWQRALAALTAYRASTGHCRVPRSHTTADGLKLGRAVSKIRSREMYVKGRPDRRAQLDALGFVWDGRACR